MRDVNPRPNHFIIIFIIVDASEYFKIDVGSRMARAAPSRQHRDLAWLIQQILESELKFVLILEYFDHFINSFRLILQPQ